MPKRSAAAERRQVEPAEVVKTLASHTAETPGHEPTHRENLELWDRVFATDPAHTKGFKRAGGFAGTAIKPFWLMKRATQEFGPVGIGWGWNVLEEQLVAIDDGRRMWFSSVRVWYLHGGEQRHVGPQWGGTELVARRKDGLFFDEEAPKKSVTDGITKCLSYLGFGGDVHMGLFDDSKYVADTNDEFRKEEKATTVAKASEETARWRDGVVEAVKLARSVGELETIWGGHLRHYKALAASEDKTDKAAANYVLSQFQRRKAEILQDQSAESGQPVATPAAAE